LSPLIVICLPCQKDALLSHFTKVAEALSPSTIEATWFRGHITYSQKKRQ